jgi:hypothetical protein
VYSVLYYLKNSFNILDLICDNSKLTTDFKYAEQSIGLMKLTIHLYRVPKLRIDGFTPPSPNTASKIGAYIVRGTDANLFFVCLQFISYEQQKNYCVLF